MPPLRRDWAAMALAVPGARKAGPPRGPIAPALASLAAKPPAGEGWLHELKWDGYRLMGTVTAGRAQLWSRNAKEWTAKQPRLATALESLGVESLMVDGELIAGRGTQADFNVLQTILSGKRRGALTLVLFDLLYLDGVDLVPVALLERKALLKELLSKPPAGLAFSSHVVGSGDRAFEAAAKEGFEGIISKRITSPYHEGRGDDWRKVKHLPTAEFAVVGWMPAKGARVGVGSLLLAAPDAEAQTGWRYIGRVGTGFSDDLLRTLGRRFPAEGAPAPTAEVSPEKLRTLREARWVQPELVAEVFLRGISRSGLLRQPSLKGIRLDQAPQDIQGRQS